MGTENQALSAQVLEEVNDDCNQILGHGLTLSLEDIYETRNKTHKIMSEFNESRNASDKPSAGIYALLYIGDAIVFVAKAILALRK